jgi:hypothetical protein
MRRFTAVSGSFVVFLAGYAIGTFSGQAPQRIQATQDDGNPQYSKDVLDAYRKSYKAVRELNNLYVAGGQSTAAYGGMNYFAASVGGVNAERDLEEGRGVDPETFAALYAGLAVPKIAANLDFDEVGRLRYKKVIVRLYSQDRLKQLFHQRDQLEVRSDAGE